jgi:hypothetical protein
MAAVLAVAPPKDGKNGVKNAPEAHFGSTPKHTLEAHLKHTLEAHPKHTLKAHPKHTLEAHPKHTLEAHPKHTLEAHPVTIPEGVFQHFEPERISLFKQVLP